MVGNKLGLALAAAVLAFGVGAGAAVSDTPPAAPEEGEETPPALEIQPVTANCDGVVSPEVISVKTLGEVTLIGVQPIPENAAYYGQALKFVKDRVAGEQVRVEVCPNIPHNEQGRTRAVVYFRQDEKWTNLSIALVEAGLAKVADVPGCHVPTKAWLTYENAARLAHRGMWKDWQPGKAMTSDKPDESDFQ
jgi:hypothetical protein